MKYSDIMRSFFLLFDMVNSAWLGAGKRLVFMKTILGVSTVLFLICNSFNLAGPSLFLTKCFIIVLKEGNRIF